MIDAIAEIVRLGSVAMMKRYPLFVCVILMITAVFFGMKWRDSESRLSKVESEISRMDDAIFEGLAVLLKARSEHTSIEKIASLNRPVTIRFPNRRCVELRPRWGVVGGTEVYCFETTSKRLLERHSIGE